MLHPTAWNEDIEKDLLTAPNWLHVFAMIFLGVFFIQLTQTEA